MSHHKVKPDRARRIVAKRKKLARTKPYSQRRMKLVGKMTPEELLTKKQRRRAHL